MIVAPKTEGLEVVSREESPSRGFGEGQGNVQSVQEQERDPCGRFLGDGRVGEPTWYMTLVIIRSLY